MTRTVTSYDWLRSARPLEPDHGPFGRTMSRPSVSSSSTESAPGRRSRAPVWRLLAGPILSLPIAIGCSGDDPADALDLAPPTPPLLVAAERGDISALDALLSNRAAQPDIRDACRWTPLMKAALNGHLEVVKRLVAAGAAIDAEDSGGYTAMMLAASNNHAEVVDYLLAQGAHVDHQESTQGVTALIWAAKLGHRETVAALLRHGADGTLKDFSGHTAAAWATELGFGPTAALLRSPDVDGEQQRHPES